MAELTYSVDKDGLVELCNDIQLNLVYQTLKDNLTPEQIDDGLSKAVSKFLDQQSETDVFKLKAIEQIAHQAKSEVLIQLERVK